MNKIEYIIQNFEIFIGGGEVSSWGWGTSLHQVIKIK